MKTQLKFDQKALKRKMDDLSKNQVPYALSRTFNTLAYQVQQRLRKNVDKYFDGGRLSLLKAVLYLAKAPRTFYSRLYMSRAIVHT